MLYYSYTNIYTVFQFELILFCKISLELLHTTYEYIHRLIGKTLSARKNLIGRLHIPIGFKFATKLLRKPHKYVKILININKIKKNTLRFLILSLNMNM